MVENDTLTRAAIAEAIQRKVGLSRSKSLALVEAILAQMCSAMERGENVKVSGFGTFLLRNKGERVGRNPKTGEEHRIEPRCVLTFRASSKLKDRIVSTDEELAAAEFARSRKRAIQR